MHGGVRVRVLYDTPFRRRLDWNGIYVSVCMTCLQTVATSWRNATLAEEEGQHVCHEPVVSENQGPGTNMRDLPGLRTCHAVGS